MGAEQVLGGFERATLGRCARVHAEPLLEPRGLLAEELRRLRARPRVGREPEERVDPRLDLGAFPLELLRTQPRARARARVRLLLSPRLRHSASLRRRASRSICAPANSTTASRVV